MAKWNTLKVALLVGALLPALQGWGCVADLLEDIMVGVLFD
jgi:hypothetical protein